jgi:hypothetical protein
VNALLLETAQAMDETANADPSSIEDAEHRKTVWRLSALTREGAEWVVSVPAAGNAEGWGTQSAEEYGNWMRQTLETCKRLSERIESGPLSHVQARGLERRLVLFPWPEKSFLVAWPPDADASRLLEQTKKITASWDS